MTLGRFSPSGGRVKWDKVGTLCGNSTFDLADSVCEYHVAIEAITDKQRLGLTDLALDDHEWDLLKQLHGVLKVCQSTLASYISVTM